MCLEQKKKGSTKTKLGEDGRIERRMGENTQVASMGCTEMSCWRLSSFPFHSRKVSELQPCLSNTFMVSQEKISWVDVEQALRLSYKDEGFVEL